MNNTMSTINTTIRSGATSFADDFVGELVKGESTLQALQDAAAAMSIFSISHGCRIMRGRFRSRRKMGRSSALDT
jgi:hypothetical protein